VWWQEDLLALSSFKMKLLFAAVDTATYQDPQHHASRPES